MTGTRRAVSAGADRFGRRLLRRTAFGFGSAAVVFAVACGSALAAETVPVGSGSRPAVAIDAAGTAYIAFNGTENPNPKLHFCLLPRGAAACTTAIDLPIPVLGDSLTRPFISVSGSTVRILSYRYGTPSTGDFLFTSGDGGASFGAPVLVGDLDFAGNAVEGPGGGISLLNTASANHQYQRVPTDGSAAATTRATLSTSYLYGGAVGLAGAGTPLVAFNDGASTPTSAFSVYKGAGDVNDGGSWSAPQVIGTGSGEHLASGPGGLFLMLNTGTENAVRKYSGTAFGTSTPIPNSQSSGGSDLFQDTAGTLHASWADASGTVWYATSADGMTWGTQQVVTAGAGPVDPHLAAAPDHQGFAVYVIGTGAGATVRAVPIGPPPPPVAPGAPPVASLTISPDLPCTGQQVTFDASASRGFAGSGRLTYSWLIGAIDKNQGYRNPEDVFEGNTGANPLITRSYGPFRAPKDGDDLVEKKYYYKGQIHYGEHYRVPLVARVFVTDEAGVASKSVFRDLVFGDAGYNPLDPRAPKPRCRQIRVPLPVAIGNGGLVASGANTSVVTGCPAAADCIGRVTLNAASGALSRPRAAATARTRILQLAARSFILQAGKRGKLALKLSKPAQRLLRSKGKLRVTVKIVATNQSGKTTTSRRTTTLRTAKRR